MGQGERVCVVSGCSTIEEFVAAFRQHAQRDDLFVPTRAPLAVGGRGPIAITLRDGGIVLEGQATVVATAQDKKRRGMTLRFSVLDADSRALFDHLDRERFRAKMTPVPGTIKVRPGPALLGEPRAAKSEHVECVVVGKFPSQDPDDVVIEDAPAPGDVELVAKPSAGDATDTVQMWTRIPAIPRPIASALPTERMGELAPTGEPPPMPAAYLLAPRPTTPAPEPPAKLAAGSRPLGARADAAAREERHAAAGPTARVVRHGRSDDDTVMRPMWIPVALVGAALAIIALLVYIAR